MATRGRTAPKYPGEDTSPTTPQELGGWYSYGIAAEVFAIAGLGSFLPVTLEQLARERGVLRSDGVSSCIKDAAKSEDAGRLLVRATGEMLRLTARDDGAKEGDHACVVNVLGVMVNTSSFALYTFSLAVLVQALVLVSISAIADHGNYRKRFLLTLAWTGSIACMLFIFISPSLFLFAPLLVIVSVCCLGNSFALLNSFLPLLVAQHPGQDGYASISTASSQAKPDSLQLSNKISARGTGLGYAAAVLVQIFSIGILITMNKIHITESKTLPMRLILLLVGAWWALFSIPTYMYLRSRPGPRLPNIPLTTQRWMQPLHYIAFAWRALFSTAKIAFQLRQIVIFLLAWFLMSDAIATVSGVAILFARTELHMETPAIAMVSITATCSGIAGAALWPMIQARLGLRTNQTLVACLCLFEIIPLYGLLGFVLPVLGLREQWEIFPMAFLHGFVMGGISSYARSFYGQMIPPGHEAAFYALYAVTDKGSSVIGPAVVGRIVDSTGSVRMGFWFLAVLIVAPVPLIRWVDGERGREDAVRMAAVLASKEGGGEIALGERGDRGSGDEARDEAFGLLDSDDDDEIGRERPIR